MKLRQRIAEWLGIGAFVLGFVALAAAAYLDTVRIRMVNATLWDPNHLPFYFGIPAPMAGLAFFLLLIALVLFYWD